MRRIKGPNGLVLTFPDDVAAGLLVSGDFEAVEDEPKSEPKPKPATRGRRKPKSED